MKPCPFCAEAIQDDAKKCRFCGEWLEQREAPVPALTAATVGATSTGQDLTPESREPDDDLDLATIFTLAVLLLVVLVGGWQIGGSTMGFLSLIWAAIGAAVGHAIGKSRGRPEAGLWWGVLLSFIGWLLVAAGPDLRPKCSKCGGAIVAGASRCRNCGAELTRAA